MSERSNGVPTPYACIHCWCCQRSPVARVSNYSVSITRGKRQRFPTADKLFMVLKPSPEGPTRLRERPHCIHDEQLPR